VPQAGLSLGSAFFATPYGLCISTIRVGF
jgi:hypothetical protein